MNILAKKHTFGSLIKFSAPTMIMMVLMSLYTMVDGVFVSQFVSTDALSAVNIVYPLVNIVVAVGIMLAAGASAVIATQMGEGKKREANESFTLITIIGIACGIVIAVVPLIFSDQIVRALGASEKTFEYCREYMRMIIIFSPMSILQMLFQFFFVTAGKPNVGLLVTGLAGLANMILDYIFIGPMGMGVAGAALATGIGYSIPAVYGLVYFTLKRRGTMFFVKPKFSMPVVLKSCANGSSEMVTNLSTSVTTFLFNMAMMKYLGDDGVAAMTIVLYAQFLLTAVYMGYSSGIAPIISYNHGSDNSTELKKLFKTSCKLIGIGSVLIFAIANLLAHDIVRVFAPVGSAVYAIAKNGFGLFSFAYLFIGTNIFASSMFTAFSDGKVSAIISFLRTFVFIILAVALLPQFIGVNGVWLAIPIAEMCTFAVSVAYFVSLRYTYKYA